MQKLGVTWATGFLLWHPFILFCINFDFFVYITLQGDVLRRKQVDTITLFQAIIKQLRLIYLFIVQLMI